MDWSSNLIQILLFIQFMPLKDTFSNPSLKARIWMPSQQQCDVNGSKLRGSCSHCSRHSSVTSLESRWQTGSKVWNISTPAHLPPLSPELRATIQICPLLHSPPAPILRSDPNNCRIYYTKLDENWKAAKHSACSTTCSFALPMTFHKTHLRPDDQLTFLPTNQPMNILRNSGNIVLIDSVKYLGNVVFSVGKYS